MHPIHICVLDTQIRVSHVTQFEVADRRAVSRVRDLIFADPRRVLTRLGGKVYLPPHPPSALDPPIFRRLLQTTPSEAFLSSKRTPPTVFDAGAPKCDPWALPVSSSETRIFIFTLGVSSRRVSFKAKPDPITTASVETLVRDCLKGQIVAASVETHVRGCLTG